VYSAVDVTVIPSRQENLPQSGTEAQSCGCPVVAFNAAGLPDVVAHGQTGYLAQPYSSGDLARGIEWVLADTARYARLSVQAREHAVASWAPKAIVPWYLDVTPRQWDERRFRRLSARPKIDSPQHGEAS
jgi:glycosyltransferase involved in cell wall biosynthesis